MKVAVIVITYNSKSIIGDCIESVRDSKGVSVEIIVVDNASVDGTVEYIEHKYPGVKIIKNNTNLGYAAAVNIGAKNVDTDFFVIANADVIFDHNTLIEMVSYLSKHNNVAAVGVQQVFPDGKWQKSYGAVPGVWDAVSKFIGLTSLHNMRRRLRWPKKVDVTSKQVAYIDGAVITVRKDSFESVGGFDESFFFYAEEADFCLRLRKNGWKTVFLPSARITHLRGGSSTKVDTVTDKYLKLQVRSKLILVNKHNPYWKVKLYMFFEKAHAKKMEFIFLVLRMFAPVIKREYFHNKALLFCRMAEIWDEKSEKRSDSL